jgi:hypothetical protein
VNFILKGQPHWNKGPSDPIAHAGKALFYFIFKIESFVNMNFKTRNVLFRKHQVK